MIHGKLLLPLLLSLCTWVCGCAVGTRVSGGRTEGGGASASSSDGVTGAAFDVERAIVELNLGHDPNWALSLVEPIARAAEIDPDTRDLAALALARAEHAQRNDETAILTVEKLLESHSGDVRFPTSAAASELLRELAGGQSPASAPHFEQAAVAPFARALLRYLPDVTTGPVHADIVLIGAGEVTNARLGTFNLEGALEEQRQELCPTCDQNERDIVSSVRIADWTQIATVRKRAAKAFTVVYATLEDPIPARYNDLLAVRAEELELRLRHAPGAFVSVRERPNAPPLVLIAAPVTAQLRDVEAALAARTEPPKSEMTVDIVGRIPPEDIRAAVRAAAADYRACYEELLGRLPSATGRLSLQFTITRGVASEVTSTSDGDVGDAVFVRCARSVTTRILFPVVPGAVSVTYPLSFSPPTH